jgi:2-iminobutanoate/2-iminopropanoate deaminase
MNGLTEVSTPLAPEAIGPYSQAVVSDGWIFASGQIPLDPRTGEVVGGDAAAQTDQVMRNLSAVLVAAGGGLSTVVKTTVYLSDLSNFSKVNEVYEGHFGARRPARATVEVRRLPKDVAVEIDAVARVG